MALLIKFEQFVLIMNFIRCVIKEIKHNADTQRIQNEFGILKNSNNENIIKYKDIFVEGMRTYIVSEYYKVRVYSLFNFFKWAGVDVIYMLYIITWIRTYVFIWKQVNIYIY